MYREQPDLAKGRALVRFLWWAMHDGQQYPATLLYAPLPPGVVKQVENRIKQITHAGKPLMVGE